MTETSRVLGIVERSFSIQERLDLCAAQCGESEDNARWWNEWAATLGPQGELALKRAVDWDGYSPELVKRALAARLLTRHEPLPRWVKLFRDVVDDLANHRDGAGFENFLSVFVRAARPPDGRVLPGLERRLLRRLIELSSKTLGSAFTDHLTTPTGFLNLFETYPVLARLLSEASVNWCDALIELELRLTTDLPDITRVLAQGKAVGDVVGVGAEESDPHGGGRSVVCLEFQSGFKALYKPRSLAPEVAFNQLLAYLNERAADSTFREVRCLDYGTHGWMEYVHCEPCISAQDVSQYFEGAGALLAVAYAFCIEDLHHENVIANGKYPVIVDTELFLSPEPHDLDRPLSRLEAGVRRMHADCVLSSGLLPHWIEGPNGQRLDLSGFGASVGMHAGDHGDSFTEGFRRSYRQIERLRPELLARLDAGAWSGIPVRYVYRPTRFYRSVLESSLDEKPLGDGRARSILQDSIRQSFLSGVERNPYWVVAREELRALYVMDIPRLVVQSSGIDLETAYGTVPNAFRESGVKRVERRLQKLSAADCEKQVGLIMASLDAWRQNRPLS